MTRQLADPTFPTVAPHDVRHTAASLAISTGVHVNAPRAGAIAREVWADQRNDPRSITTEVTGRGPFRECADW
ncbi:MAG: hypothetical protein R2732_05485 [Microbacteriaceae bacterium]|nr:hypothetical protein [Rhodoglobus sp.]